MEPRTRGRYALPVIIGLLAIAIYWALEIVVRSGDPGRYYRYRHHPETFVYPTDSVITWVTVVLVEAVIASLFIVRARSVPRACAWLAIPFACGFAMLFVFAMHAPPYFGLHLFWLLVAVGWLLLSSFVTYLATRPR